MKASTRYTRLRSLLEGKKKALLADLRKAMEEQRTAHARLSFELAQDDGDKSVGEHERHVQSAVQSLTAKQLDDIEHALKKLQDGTYGLCEECGCEIPVKRLDALPFAAYCVSCQKDIDSLDRRDTLWNKEPNPASDEPYDFLPDE